MSRKITRSPYRQDDPSPGDRHRRRRAVIFVIIVLLGGAGLAAGQDLQTVLLSLLGLSLVSATAARWVTDDTPLPSLATVLTPPSDRQGQGR